MPSVTSEGKPTIFFSSNEADKAWRLKEKIVAVIESYFQEREDIFTFSSTKVKDVIGSLEEVDVANTSFDDPKKRFSFVEVRDRSEKVGRQYIEEIMGKKMALNINNCLITSTRGFSRDAVKLASHEHIPLRLLLPEKKEKIMRWYKSKSIKFGNPSLRLAKCSILAKDGNMILEFKAEGDRLYENSLLVPTEKQNKYYAISISRAFMTETIQNKKKTNELLAKIPPDGEEHRVFISIEYEQPKFYLSRRLLKNEKGHNNRQILPVVSIVFIALIRGRIEAEITDYYQYTDAITNKKLAEFVLASFKIKEKMYYVCLVRHHCTMKNYKVGAAFFS